MSNNNSGLSKTAAIKLVEKQNTPRHVTENTRDTIVSILGGFTVGEHRRLKALGRNEPCPCGSGKKWKACHGRAAVPVYAPRPTMSGSGKRLTGGKISDATGVPEDDGEDVTDRGGRTES